MTFEPGLQIVSLSVCVCVLCSHRDLLSLAKYIRSRLYGFTDSPYPPSLARASSDTVFFPFYFPRRDLQHALEEDSLIFFSRKHGTTFPIFNLVPKIISLRRPWGKNNSSVLFCRGVTLEGSPLRIPSVDSSSLCRCHTREDPFQISWTPSGSPQDPLKIPQDPPRIPLLVYALTPGGSSGDSQGILSSVTLALY